MDDFSFLLDMMASRLQDLQDDATHLGRPVLALVPGQLAVDHAFASRADLRFRIAPVPFPPRDASWDTLKSFLPFLPRAGESVLAGTCDGYLSGMAPPWDGALMTDGFMAALVHDGVLPVLLGSDGTSPEKLVADMELLIDAMERALDPGMKDEGQEDHEDDALAHRLANPGLSPRELHAPMVPPASRGMPVTLLTDHFPAPEPGTSATINVDIPEMTPDRTLQILVPRVVHDLPEYREAFGSTECQAENTPLPQSVPGAGRGCHRWQGFWEFLDSDFRESCIAPGPFAGLVPEDLPAPGNPLRDVLIRQRISDAAWMIRCLEASGTRVCLIPVPDLPQT